MVLFFHGFHINVNLSRQKLQVATRFSDVINVLDRSEGEHRNNGWSSSNFCMIDIHCNTHIQIYIYVYAIGFGRKVGGANPTQEFLNSKPHFQILYYASLLRKKRGGVSGSYMQIRYQNWWTLHSAFNMGLHMFTTLLQFQKVSLNLGY